MSGAGEILDVWYPEPILGPIPESAIGSIPQWLADLETSDPDLHRARQGTLTHSLLDEPVAGAEDAYLRLHLLSHRLVVPNSINLEGLIPALPNNVWTNVGPIASADFDALRPSLRARGIVATGIDKFPRLLDYVTPPHVRIADASRVRLGAYLSPGTTVMHEGFVNFNAGTLGVSMVEGRISQGVVVHDGADIGGGASIMGTLSGGGTVRVEIGAHALLGANAGIGISLGDNSVVEAGLYVTAGTKVTFLNDPVPPQFGDWSDRGPAAPRTRDCAQRAVAHTLIAISGLGALRQPTG